MIKGLVIAGCVLLGAIAWWCLRDEGEPGRIGDDERIAVPASAIPAATLQVLATGPDQPVHVGQNVHVGFVLKNLGPKPAWVLGSLDGSVVGRYPRCILEIRNVDGVQEFPKPPLGCGNMNPLDSRDFIRLAAGETLKQPLSSYIGWWKPSKPGIYSIVLTYDASSPYLQAYAGDARSFDERTRELLSLIPKGKVVSNVVSLTVVP